MKTNFRSIVFKRAWIMARESGKRFTVCLRKAWRLYRLRKQMSARVVKFLYKKVNGDRRYAVGTLQENYLNAIKGERKPNPRVMTYYDLEAADFRCFRIENLVRVY